MGRVSIDKVLYGYMVRRGCYRDAEKRVMHEW